MSSPYPTPPPCSAGKGESPTPASAPGSLLTAAPSGDARELLGAEELMTVTATLARLHPNMGWVMAEQVINEALKFVAAAARCGEALVPSPSSTRDGTR